MKDMILFDKALWFEHLGCTGKHFLIGNPHTVTGRMWAWCPKEKASIFVSKSDLGKMSKAAEYWVKGFLCGNQPDPPTNKSGDLDFKSAAYKKWLKQVAIFEKTGNWK
jgi:hypothetical protein